MIATNNIAYRQVGVKKAGADFQLSSISGIIAGIGGPLLSRAGSLLFCQHQRKIQGQSWTKSPIFS